ncbi:ZYRO0C16126p [Zygosaccharomyces rouxii]|uniref:ZYRO0C16126p n=1 Tax=Zygosaccharomyces rouxii (strain ATCC 2623 / CBS 732 / NBRC 1130 / NCYC 568 / NRRL Y-229) TaxID=559307 RepID=C5DUE6_ZYGRC|nr:uncharacterized protein ZYRO0C16126g [Zygosaccharomyces rouxii]KAH9201421.1 hypothetical protein LQ764DRAFT_79025 [Zygosaccharomyces rouxii]CAR27407.1 ZYRO0C16126p [Zygosaccharomyces rouxii]
MITRQCVGRNFIPQTRRWASHMNVESDNNSHIFDSEWTQEKNPTPYSVFGFRESCGVDRKQLKKRYHGFAKLYHPDISDSLRITRSPSPDDSISSEEKLQRFRMVTNAYEILNDDSKKRLYDHTHSGWSYGPQGSRATNNGFQQGNSHGYKSNATYAYYNAGTWEDLNDLGKEDRAKLDPWTLLLWVCGLAICFEGTSLLSRLEDTIVGKHFTQEQTENDLVQSRINYGLETDKFNRLRRFLWFRAFGLYRSKDELDREAIKNERMVQNLKNKERERRDQE